MAKASDAKKSLRLKLNAPVLAESDNVLEVFKKSLQFKSSQKLAFYIAMKDEVNLNNLLNVKKDKFLPIYDKELKAYKMALVRDSKDLVEGRFGILEPSPKCPVANTGDIDTWLIPGRAFDKNGNRLGRGGGFYDRLLENESGIKIGVPADGKVLDDIPTEEWDIKMNFLLLENEVVKCQ